MLRRAQLTTARKIATTNCTFQRLRVLQIVVRFYSQSKWTKTGTLEPTLLRAAERPGLQQNPYSLPPNSCYPLSGSHFAQGAPHMEWVTPQHEEIDLNCEISSYANAEL